ncbi:M16 family metallopeptidase [Streptomyces sp. NPDC087218]|uniref:M16 family metallopeptidase n=1 Tax=Streptomyces sp. NPDC087218 TaxID=3365769 RepID=UPI00381DBF85
MESFPVTEHRLDNGLRVVLSPDPLNPVAAVCVWYGVGSRHERTGRTGMAHLFEHLMFQGSRNVPGNGHFALLHEAGGRPNGTTNFERTNFTETVPSHHLELALWLEADRMGGLLDALTQESLDNQRDVVKNERRQRYDNIPYGTGWERLVAMAYPPGHPYHHLPIGSMADLDAASLQDTRDFFTTHYTPDNAVLAVVGDIDPERTLSWIRRYFGGIAGPAGTVPPPEPDLPALLGAERRTVVRGPVPSGAVMHAYRMPHDGTREAEVAAVAFAILGSGQNSRLKLRLIRRDRSASSLSTGLIRLAGAPSLGWLDIKAAARTTTADLEASLDEELGRFAVTGPTEDELARARAHLERVLLTRLETVGGRADELCRQATFFGTARRATAVLDGLRAVTVEDVRAFAALRLHPANRAVLVFEPEAASSDTASCTAAPGAVTTPGEDLPR